MENNTSLAKHLSLIDKLIVGLLTLQGPMDDSQKLSPTGERDCLANCGNAKESDVDRGDEEDSEG
ncbi:hypothetical protein ABG067_007793, partial [Albugo candida]